MSADVKTHASGATFVSASRGGIIIARLLGGHPAYSGIGSIMAGMPPPTTSQSQDSASQCGRER